MMTTALVREEKSKIDLEVKGLIKPVLSNDDDCSVANCSGLVDPWTCECISDLKDPWEDEVMASKMRSTLKLEAALLKGKGKDVLPASMVQTARKKYPGKSLKAITSRLNYYSKTAK